MFAGRRTKRSLRLVRCLFFIDFLKQADLFDPYAEDCPLQYSSRNAPEVRDVLGTLLLSIAAGGRRNTHVNALWHDGINPPLPG